MLFLLTTLLSACTEVTSQVDLGDGLTEGGSSLGSSDRSIAKKNLQHALEKSLSGNAMRWQNPASGASGSVTPLRTWKTAQGTYCRAYLERITFSSGKSLSREGIACRTSSAVWLSA
ncbi:hypothetical protein JF539_22875 [Labrenzia aggregata]|uniref:Surface antigen domain-containing protein n=1 Tax=Roseibium aggregatum TaxID=187304 RepID=A0A939EHH4_9HYPH|nr:hypothetical protein [Roseibium aggregatum]